jgi:hypothetical protein
LLFRLPQPNRALELVREATISCLYYAQKPTLGLDSLKIEEPDPKWAVWE